jgi:hypothetical protein
MYHFERVKQVLCGGGFVYITIFCHFKLFTKPKELNIEGVTSFPLGDPQKLFGLSHSKAKSRFPSTNLRFSWVKNIASKRPHSRRCQSFLFFLVCKICPKCEKIKK